MIQIKTYSKGWVQMTKEQARVYLNKIVQSAPSKIEEKAKYINERKLKGITFEELYPELMK